MNISVLCVTFNDAILVTNLIKSFQKFKPADWNIQYVIVENTTNNRHKELVCNLDPEVTFINVPFGEKYNIQKGQSSLGHGMAYDAGKKFIKHDWTFICHSDCLVVSELFFEEMSKKVDDGNELIGVCYDDHPDRIKAIHCSGYLVKTEILNNTTMLPDLPKYDTTDKVTEYCRQNNKKMFTFRNTYNDRSLTSIINEPFKSLGPDCGVDRCIADTSNEVIYIHQGRGTSKLMKNYFKPGKINTEVWLALCNVVLV